MTGHEDASDARAARSRDGLSRRDLIKGAAAAGAAAWSAPIILGSVASPAAALSFPCKKYYAKFQRDGSSFDLVSYTPSCGYALATGPGGASINIGLNPGTYAAVTPTVSSYDSRFWKVQLSGSCKFTKTVFDGVTNPAGRWLLIGNYDGTCNNLETPSTGTPPSNSLGFFVNESNVAYVRKRRTTSASSDEISYIYTQFCCPS